MKELYINENLTNVRKSLLYEAKKIKEDSRIQFCWEIFWLEKIKKKRYLRYVH